jgi:GxxExxY protein
MQENRRLTQMSADERRLNDLSHAIIGSAYKVSNALGAGFVEKVYENALALEIRKAGFNLSQQQAIPVRYEGLIVGDFFCDLLVEGMVFVELKAAKAIDDAHIAQCLNYPKATSLHLCLLLNFGQPRVEVRRVVLRL